jgi:hypothetical protein
MADTQTLENSYVEPTTGLRVVRKKVVLSAGATSATVSGAWSSVEEVSAVSASASATKDWYFNGTNVLIAGFAANSTIYVTIKGIQASA